MSRTTTKLARLALRVHELLLSPGVMARVRELALAELDNPEYRPVAASWPSNNSTGPERPPGLGVSVPPSRFQFPTDPDEPLDWTPGSVLRERDKTEAYAVVTDGGTVLVLAALHDVHCIGAEPVIADEEVRGLVWTCLKDRVAELGDHAELWFELRLLRFEQILDADAGARRPPKESVERPTERLAELRSAIVSARQLAEDRGETLSIEDWRDKIAGFWDEVRSIALPGGEPVPERPGRVLTREHVRGALQVLIDWMDGKLVRASVPNPPPVIAACPPVSAVEGGAPPSRKSEPDRVGQAGASAQLLTASEKARLSGMEARVVRIIAEKGGKVPTVDAETLCGGDALSAFKRAKPKMKKQGWNLCRRDNQLCAVPLLTRVRK